MIHLILVILKTIGIVLLWILAIAVILLLLVLLVPFCYGADGSFHDGKAEIKARGSWLLHAVHFSFAFRDGKTAYALRLFGVPVFSSDKESKTAKRSMRKRHGKRYKRDNAAEEEGTLFSEQEISEEKNTAAAQQILKAAPEMEKSGEPPFEKPLLADSCGEGAQYERQKDNDKGFFDKLRNFVLRLKGFFRSVADKLHSMEKSIERLISKKDRIIAFLESETFNKAFESLKRNGLKLLKHIRPRKLRITLCYGMEDPSVTGKVFGAISCIRPYLPGRYDITPDFNEKCLDGSFLVRGHVILICIIPSIWHLYRDKNIRRCYHKFNK